MFAPPKKNAHQTQRPQQQQQPKQSSSRRQSLSSVPSSPEERHFSAEQPSRRSVSEFLSEILGSEEKNEHTRGPRKPSGKALELSPAERALRAAGLDHLWGSVTEHDSDGAGHIRSDGRPLSGGAARGVVLNPTVGVGTLVYENGRVRNGTMSSSCEEPTDGLRYVRRHYHQTQSRSQVRAVGEFADVRDGDVPPALAWVESPHRIRYSTKAETKKEDCVSFGNKQQMLNTNTMTVAPSSSPATAIKPFVSPTNSSIKKVNAITQTGRNTHGESTNNPRTVAARGVGEYAYHDREQEEERVVYLDGNEGFETFKRVISGLDRQESNGGSTLGKNTAVAGLPRGEEGVDTMIRSRNGKKYRETSSSLLLPRGSSSSAASSPATRRTHTPPSTSSHLVLSQRETIRQQESIVARLNQHIEAHLERYSALETAYNTLWKEHITAQRAIEKTGRRTTRDLLGLLCGVEASARQTLQSAFLDSIVVTFSSSLLPVVALRYCKMEANLTKSVDTARRTALEEAQRTVREVKQECEAVIERIVSDERQASARAIAASEEEMHEERRRCEALMCDQQRRVHELEKERDLIAKELKRSVESLQESERSQESTLGRLSVVEEILRKRHQDDEENERARGRQLLESNAIGTQTPSYPFPRAFADPAAETNSLLLGLASRDECDCAHDGAARYPLEKKQRELGEGGLICILMAALDKKGNNCSLSSVPSSAMCPEESNAKTKNKRSALEMLAKELDEAFDVLHDQRRRVHLNEGKDDNTDILNNKKGVRKDEKRAGDDSSKTFSASLSSSNVRVYYLTDEEEAAILREHHQTTFTHDKQTQCETSRQDKSTMCVVPLMREASTETLLPSPCSSVCVQTEDFGWMRDNVALRCSHCEGTAKTHRVVGIPNKGWHATTVREHSIRQSPMQMQTTTGSRSSSISSTRTTSADRGPFAVVHNTPVPMKHEKRTKRGTSGGLHTHGGYSPSSSSSTSYDVGREDTYSSACSSGNNYGGGVHRDDDDDDDSDEDPSATQSELSFNRSHGGSQLEEDAYYSDVEGTKTRMLPPPQYAIVTKESADACTQADFHAPPPMFDNNREDTQANELETTRENTAEKGTQAENDRRLSVVTDIDPTITRQLAQLELAESRLQETEPRLVAAETNLKIRAEELAEARRLLSIESSRRREASQALAKLRGEAAVHRSAAHTAIIKAAALTIGLEASAKKVIALEKEVLRAHWLISEIEEEALGGAGEGDKEDERDRDEGEREGEGEPLRERAMPALLALQSSYSSSLPLATAERMLEERLSNATALHKDALLSALTVKCEAALLRQVAEDALLRPREKGGDDDGNIESGVDNRLPLITAELLGLLGVEDEDEEDENEVVAECRSTDEKKLAKHQEETKADTGKARRGNKGFNAIDAAMLALQRKLCFGELELAAEGLRSCLDEVTAFRVGLTKGDYTVGGLGAEGNARHTLFTGAVMSIADAAAFTQRIGRKLHAELVGRIYRLLDRGLHTPFPAPRDVAAKLLLIDQKGAQRNASLGSSLSISANRNGAEKTPAAGIHVEYQFHRSSRLSPRPSDARPKAPEKDQTVQFSYTSSSLSSLARLALMPDRETERKHSPHSTQIRNYTVHRKHNQHQHILFDDFGNKEHSRVSPVNNRIHYASSRVDNRRSVASRSFSSPVSPSHAM